jgi:3-oxoacyl-[acyl-carrier protein] reductase
MGALDSRVALVTGGTRGLGRAIALKFLKEGAKVAVCYGSDDEAAIGFMEEARAYGGCLAVKADVTDRDQVQAMFLRVGSELGTPTILVHSAGVIKDGFLMLMGEEDWDRVVDVSLKGAYNTAKAACRGMVAAKYGRIINLVSPSAITGRAGQTNYSAAKGGLVSFTKSLARELAPFSVTVNALSPGVIETGLTSNLTEKVRKELLSLIPLGRYGNADEVAEAALFLASDDASYITGQVLSVDGGIAM